VTCGSIGSRDLRVTAETLFSFIAADLIAQRGPYMAPPELGLFVSHAGDSHPFEATDVTNSGGC
jgi:hypothetical protein